MDTNAKTVISAAGPEDMIATVWFSLGYKPRNSLVVLGLEGPRQRVGVLMRADLPGADRMAPPALRVMLPEMVRDLLGTVAASGADGVLAIVADEQALDRRPPPVVRTLRRGVREFGVRLIDVLGVTSTAFTSLLCRDPHCCSPAGRPIEQVLDSRSAVAHVMNGDTVAESEADLLADVTPGPADRPCDPPAKLPCYPPPHAWLPLERRWRWWENWLTACAAAAQRPARTEPLRGFSAALHDSHLRDAVLMNQLGATSEEVRTMLDGTYGVPVRFTEGLGRLLRSRPDVERLEAGRIVLAGAIRVAAEGDRGPALAVLAMLAWFEGKGGRARLLLERAGADAPSVSLARLVEDVLALRVPPPWLQPGTERS